MAVSSALATSRRSLVASGAAAVIAVVALIVALLSGSGSDSTSDDGAAVPSTEAAEFLADAQETVAAAQAAADRAQEAASQVAAAIGAAEQAANEASIAAELARESAASAALEAAAASRLATGSTSGGGSTNASSATSGTDASGDSTGTDNDLAADPTGALNDDIAAEDSLPGEPYNDYGPVSGTGLAVVGINYDSSLNVRDVPVGDVIARLSNSINVDSEAAVIVRAPDSPERLATLDLNTGVTATGNTRRLTSTVWHEIRMGDMLGWASSAFLSPLGATSDITADLIEGSGEPPAADSLTELAEIVARAVIIDDQLMRSVVSGAPVDGDPSEVTVDVLGLPDDSIHGYRLQIFAERSDSGSYTLRSVESTVICDSRRGVSDSGACN